MLIVSVSLRKIPDRSLGLIIAASAQDCRACVLVCVFVGPLPDIADHVRNAKWARSVRVRIHIVGTAHRSALIGHWHSTSIPRVAPRVDAAIGSLRGQLPLPLMRQALACPLEVGARIFQ